MLNFGVWNFEVKCHPFNETQIVSWRNKNDDLWGKKNHVGSFLHEGKGCFEVDIFKVVHFSDLFRLCHYCWWKKSCNIWDVKNLVKLGINYQPQLVDFSHQQYVPSEKCWNFQPIPAMSFPGRGKNGPCFFGRKRYTLLTQWSIVTHAI